MFICKTYEDYDTPVLMTALAIIHYPSERINDDELRQSTTYTYTYAETQNVIGYIINNGDIDDREHKNMNHWVALRKTPGTTTFRFINSMATGPDTTEFASLSDYLTKRHRYPRFRAVIKVLERNDRLNIGSILASVRTIQQAEAAKAATLEQIKRGIATIIGGFKTLSATIRGQYIRLSGFAESQEQLERLRKLLTHPQIGTILQESYNQLIELLSPRYRHFKLETFILLLTLILQKKEETNPTTPEHPFDPITIIDKIISFYFTAGEETQEDIIYNFLTAEERDITLAKIDSNELLSRSIDSLMNGKILKISSKGHQFIFNNPTSITATPGLINADRTTKFIDAILNTSGAPPFTAVDTAVQTRRPSPVLDQTAAAPLAESLSIPTVAVPVSVGECFIYTDSNPIFNLGSSINAKNKVFRCDKIINKVIYGNRYSESQQKFVTPSNRYIFDEDTFQFINKTDCPLVTSVVTQDPPAVAQPSRLTPEENIEYLKKAAKAKINTIKYQFITLLNETQIKDKLTTAVSNSNSESDLTTFLEQCTNLVIWWKARRTNTTIINSIISILDINSTTLHNINNILISNLPPNLVATESKKRINEFMLPNTTYVAQGSSISGPIDPNSEGKKESARDPHVLSGEPINTKHRLDLQTLRSTLKSGNKRSRKKSRVQISSESPQVANVESSKLL